jgi:hypothetical protein
MEEHSRGCRGADVVSERLHLFGQVSFMRSGTVFISHKLELYKVVSNTHCMHQEALV